MNESTMTSTTATHSSPRASLAAIGALLRQRHLFDPVREHVTIAQKTVQYTPTDKLYDAVIAILAGAHGLVEVNTRLRSDRALQRAFGRRNGRGWHITENFVNIKDRAQACCTGLAAHPDQYIF